MPDYDVDITNCHQEPIHLIGEVQTYGTLVAADTSDLVIRQVAANTRAILGLEPDELLGLEILELVGREQLAVLRADWESFEKAGTTRVRQITIAAGEAESRRLECVAHRHAAMVVLEFLPERPASASKVDADLFRQRLVYELTKPSTIEELATLGAQLYRLIIGYDRVMVYKFHEDKHGHVLAESTNRPDSFLGLHYPASDIPEPARRHFILNTTRIIADVDDAPAPIQPARHPVLGKPLDLTHSKLRAVSPIHIRYLKNMDVRASLSISLIVNGQLWGLVACHHYQPRWLSATELHLCDLFGGLLATFIQGLENTEKLRKSIAAEDLAFVLESNAPNRRALATVVETHAASLMELVDAQGLVLHCGDQFITSGRLPDPVPPLDRLSRHAEDGVWITNRLTDTLDLSDAQVERCAGGAWLALSEDETEYVFFSRENYPHTVDWAGDPNKNTTQTTNGNGELSPRRSFALWQQEVSGSSQPFDPATLEALRILRRALFALRSVEREHQALEAKAAAEAEQAQLKIALLEAARKNSLGELANAMAHELNQPLAALMNYVNACRQELTRLDQKLPSEIMELMDEAVAEADRAGTLVRRLRRFIEQGDLEQSPLDANEVVESAVRLALSMTSAADVALRTRLAEDVPLVWGDRLQIEQVIFNLVRNSVEAMDGVERKIISVASRRLDGSIEVSIRDTGPGIPRDLGDDIFDPLRSTKPSGMGIGLSLCRSIIRAHGGWIEARNTEEGAEIAFSLPFKQVEIDSE